MKNLTSCVLWMSVVIVLIFANTIGVLTNIHSAEWWKVLVHVVCIIAAIFAARIIYMRMIQYEIMIMSCLFLLIQKVQKAEGEEDKKTEDKD